MPSCLLTAHQGKALQTTIETAVALAAPPHSQADNQEEVKQNVDTRCNGYPSRNLLLASDHVHQEAHQPNRRIGQLPAKQDNKWHIRSGKSWTEHQPEKDLANHNRHLAS